jgi:hypothetical protein
LNWKVFTPAGYSSAREAVGYMIDAQFAQTYKEKNTSGGHFSTLGYIYSLIKLYDLAWQCASLSLRCPDRKLPFKQAITLTCMGEIRRAMGENMLCELHGLITIQAQADSIQKKRQALANVLNESFYKYIEANMIRAELRSKTADSGEYFFTLNHQSDAWKMLVRLLNCAQQAGVRIVLPREQAEFLVQQEDLPHDALARVVLVMTPSNPNQQGQPQPQQQPSRWPIFTPVATPMMLVQAPRAPLQDQNQSAWQEMQRSATPSNGLMPLSPIFGPLSGQ